MYVASDGVNVTIMGANVYNDGYIGIDLLDSGNKIWCMTDNDYCCNSASGILGNWYFPNGTRVLNKMESRAGARDAPYFARNRNPSVVRLFRVDNDHSTSNSPPQRGRFYCEVPDDQNITQRYYINICMLMLLQPHASCLWSQYYY